jgi:hypothetical protein
MSRCALIQNTCEAGATFAAARFSSGFLSILTARIPDVRVVIIFSFVDLSLSNHMSATA